MIEYELTNQSVYKKRLKIRSNGLILKEIDIYEYTANIK